MNKFIRLGLMICAVCFTLTGCGFTPVYSDQTTTSDGTSVREAVSNTYVDIIPDRVGVTLRNHLIDKFYDDGTPVNPDYILRTDLVDVQLSNLDLTEAADATRVQIRLRTTFRIIDTSNNQVATSQQVTAITSYNVLASEFATRVSRQAATDAAVEQLAEQIERRVSLYYSSL